MNQSRSKIALLEREGTILMSVFVTDDLYYRGSKRRDLEIKDPRHILGKFWTFLVETKNTVGF